jgi:sugar/nucleoside kinase (ribokinase family)
MDIDLLLVHPVDRSITVSEKGTLELTGRVIEKPKILTGGGDNLNAGFCLGLINGFDIEECMMLGMATSGAYVQQGVSPTLNDLVKFLKEF